MTCNSTAAAMRVATERLSSPDNGGAFKAKLLGLICLAMVSTPLLAVNCTPDSITLSSQSEVDGFQANHGPCDTIVGVLTVSGGDITDLAPLSAITTGIINSKILIQNNPSLINLDGLSGLASVYWIEINSNQALTSISGLSNLGSVSGPLILHGNTSLTNVTGLEGVTNLTGGALFLMGNDNLSDLSGLSNLTNITASLAIRNNGSLATLDDLTALESVGSSIGIDHNDMLTSIAGLSGVSGFSGWLEITGNPVLGSLEGVSGITSLEGLRIRSNPLITNVDNLSGVTTIGNAYSAVEIYNNASLENLDGLAALVSLDADLWVTDNPQLDQCSGLETLLDEVDDAQPGPGPGAAGIPDINGDVILSGNLSGCNAVEEIVDTSLLPPNDANFIAGESEFLLKGFGVTRGCLESMIRLPGPMTSQSRNLLHACAMQDYAEDETLVYRPADQSCRTLRARNVEAVSYEFPVHVPHSPDIGSLEAVSDAMFLEDDAAFLVLNLRTQELTRASSLDCPPPRLEPPEVIFVDSFE
ncbi:hypothetical protein G4Y73_08940 [Wenzhouxiangella sp. XN201]|uniref:hypothetical protein n=1 Tax=Wenzhouxiangella sp. XN201 TaxID=2710755 RepID=UPI0013CB0FC5|nr:hypothetical protein [Wenzhouxiangella sp. XN201]NEZ04268.1 hypothetical protein [Wenzhouxiangella sp. XN201]